MPVVKNRPLQGDKVTDDEQYRALFLAECCGIGLRERFPGDNHITFVVLVRQSNVWSPGHQWSAMWLPHFRACLHAMTRWLMINGKECPGGASYEFKAPSPQAPPPDLLPSIRADLTPALAVNLARQLGQVAVLICVDNEPCWALVPQIPCTLDELAKAMSSQEYENYFDGLFEVYHGNGENGGLQKFHIEYANLTRDWVGGGPVVFIHKNKPVCSKCKGLGIDFTDHCEGLLTGCCCSCEIGQTLAIHHVLIHPEDA